jgi:serine/threonine protein kinase
MPAPANAEELLDLIQKSGVVDEAKLRSYVQKLSESTGIPKDPAKLAGSLVRDAVLTYFQAEQLLQGKYKRFSIGKYKVLEKLGAGGMAQVFLCEHKLMRRRVAIKVLPTAKADDPSSLDRFYREARAVAAVDHPNIVRAYDIDQDEHLHFLVMEYVDGTNLQDLVKKIGPLEIVRACHYIYGSAIGLQHAHEIGLIHRDIKPGNILIDRSGVVKILDMGLARFFNDEDDVLTKKYDENVLGTADYLAPEQALDSHSVDIRADIYSLGATFYYLLTGSALFPEGSVAQKLIWHQTRQPRPLRSLRPEVPEEIVAIVDRMMAKEPAKRYQTPSEILAALGPWVTTPIPPPADKEIPQVSPAAGGGPTAPLAGNRGLMSSGQKTSDHARGFSPDAPTLVASGATPTLQSSPSNLQTMTSAGNPAVWESLDNDTQSVAQGDTDRGDRVAEPKSKPRKKNSKKTGGNAKIFVFVGIGVFLLAGVAVALFFAFSKKHPAPDLQANSHRIVVSSTGGEGSVPKLSAALNKAVPGDTIVIADEKVQETFGLALTRSKHQNITIESGLPEGKIPVIEYSGPPNNAGAILRAPDSVDGFRIRNIEFDGKNAITSGMIISGSCPGVTLENVTIRNVQYGIQMRNAAGDATRPIVFDRARFFGLSGGKAPNDDSAAILVQSSEPTKFLQIRNSRFEGPCKSGIRVEGEALDIEISGNRFFNLNSAVSLFTKEKISKGVQIYSNTFFDVKATCITLEISKPQQIPDRPPPIPGKFEQVTINQNYFGKANEIGSKRMEGGDPAVGLASRDNAKGPDVANDGNLGISLTPLPNPVPPTDPNNDATFLRFPGGPPELPNKVRAGAP